MNEISKIILMRSTAKLLSIIHLLFKVHTDINLSITWCYFKHENIHTIYIL